MFSLSTHPSAKNAVTSTMLWVIWRLTTSTLVRTLAKTRSWCRSYEGLRWMNPNIFRSNIILFHGRKVTQTPQTLTLYWNCLGVDVEKLSILSNPPLVPWLPCCVAWDHLLFPLQNDNVGKCVFVILWYYRRWRCLPKISVWWLFPLGWCQNYSLGVDQYSFFAVTPKPIEIIPQFRLKFWYFGR